MQINLMKRIYDKRPKEHRKRVHYNGKGVAKQSFCSEYDAAKFIRRIGLTGYVAYFCQECNYWHIGRNR